MPPKLQTAATRKLISEKVRAAWRRNPRAFEKRDAETAERMRGNQHAFKRGFFKGYQGYWFILKKEHPRAKHNRGYVKRCILVMEKKLGRYLSPGETVHHINEDRGDDRPANLHLFKNKLEHLRHHHGHRVRRSRSTKGQ